ncbi:type VI secretion protein IcmF/TssM N-terminal domain-containing protein [Bacterioplanoides sp.]|uniref:type VI secretion protein IcmF/TssM N-terminal domain-containing protein n=1 Tax=Bacterioplanoides sp. TaxID=2066072 RepID=UPI003AFFE9EC
MKTFLKILLWMFIILLVSSVVLSITYLLERPMIEGAYALGAIFGLWLTVVIIRKLIIRYRARNQVKSILNQGEGVNDSDDLGMTPAELSRSLRFGWNRTVRALKRSQLKFQGDPLYVLPWYMIFGRPTSGKSTSLRNAKLLLPSIDLSEKQEGSTLNIEWWLHEEGIVLDTAGRYAVPDNLERDRKEWTQLLNMVAKHKQKEPLNGVILVVAANRLLGASEAELLEEGRQVRNSINRMMEKLEVKVPVYLMVTKSDLIPGFSEWVNGLPEDSKVQAMGYLNDSDSGDYESIANHALDNVTARLKDLRLLMLEQDSNVSDDVLMLPVAMERLRAGLHTFIKTALKGNAYQEAPPFRGLYFSSSVHDEQGKTVADGMFLHDLFTKILPSDRSFLVNLPSAVRFRRAISRYAFGISGAVTFVALVALSALFNQDREALNDIYTNYSSSKIDVSSEKMSIDSRLENLYRLKDLIESLEAYQEGSIVPWSLISGNVNPVVDLKEEFVHVMQKSLLAPYDNNLKVTIDALERRNISALAGGLVRRINILQDRLNPPEEEVGEDLPIGKDYIAVQDLSVSSDASSLYSELYTTYVGWNPSLVALNDEKISLQSKLLYLIKNNHGDYSWIVQWADSQGFDSVRLKDYWGGSITLPEPPVIQPAFTLSGYEFIQSFLSEFQRANSDDKQLTEIKQDFDLYYQREYIETWLLFARNFDEGKFKQRDREEWSALLDRMATSDNPYFRLMEDMYQQLSPFEDADYPSKGQLALFTEIQSYSISDGRKGRGNNRLLKKALGKLGKAGKLAKQGLKIHKKATKGQKDDAGDSVLDDAVKSVDAYKQALAEVAFRASSRSQSLDSITTLFTSPDSPEKGSGPVASAWGSVKDLQSLVGRPVSNTRLFWQLFTGPIDTAYDYMQRESSCEIQDRWENNVLAELSGIPRNELGNAIVGEEGLLWNFVDTEVAPFVSKRYKRGYIKADVNDRSLQLDDAFLEVVNKASDGAFVVGNEFVVSMNALPSGSNPDASVSPYATFIDLHCSSGTQTMANYNYPTQHNFLWSLENCGDVSLRIDIGQLMLTKDYNGVKGFAKFLTDFHGGRRVFTPEDFPNQQAQLENLNVRYIDLNYEIEGQRPVIQTLDTVPLDLPSTIAYCW